MKAVTWHGRHDLRVSDVPEPALVNPHDAIIRVTMTAICGTDLHLYNGFMPGMRPGDIIGHEFMGDVVAVARGELVRGVVEEVEGVEELGPRERRGVLRGGPVEALTEGGELGRGDLVDLVDAEGELRLRAGGLADRVEGVDELLRWGRRLGGRRECGDGWR